MKRPHRSIETFDISLMAVVTKAMGAFLVLMLLLIPYYKSGPLGQKTVDDVTKKIEGIDASIKNVVAKMTPGSSDEVRKPLNDAVKQLEETRPAMAQMKRSVDQLNAQVQRLDEEKAAAEAAVAPLKAQVKRLDEEKATLVADASSLKAQEKQPQNDEAASKAELERLKKENADLKIEAKALRVAKTVLSGQVRGLRVENKVLKNDVTLLKLHNQRLAPIRPNLPKGPPSVKLPVAPGGRR